MTKPTEQLHNPKRQQRRELEKTYPQLKSGRQWKKFKKMLKNTERLSKTSL